MNKLNMIENKLKSKGLKYQLHNLNLKDHELGVDEHVKALGIKYKEGLSTLMYIDAEGNYFAILRRDDRNIYNKAIKKLINKPRFCNESEILNFGFKPGLASPIILEDQNKAITIIIDSKVKEMNKIICGSTLPATALEIDLDALLSCIDNHRYEDITVPNPKRQDDFKKVILTGDTPTGKLHIGHYVGALENRVKLQDEYETYVIIANIHAYANYYKESEKINASIKDVLLDNLAVGIDPEKSNIFLESEVSGIMELYTFFLTMVTHQRLVRNPSVKDEIRYKKLNPSEAFIAYPILQAADILAFNANLVPVGKDQLPMIEQTREIARDFNSAYGELFSEPDGMMGRISKLCGIDGDPKMSKSKGNTIFLSDTEDDLRKKVMSMYTDPNRIRPTDPGTVKGNPVFVYHDAFNKNKEEVKDLKNRYKQGKVGDVEVKQKLFLALNEFLGPIRDRRNYYESHFDEARDILRTGTKNANTKVNGTVEKFRKLTKINGVIE